MAIALIDTDIKLGFHISKKKTLMDSFECMTCTPLRSYQIYLSNGRSYEPPKYDTVDLLETRKLLTRQERYSCIHGCLLYNLAGSVDHLDDPKYHVKLGNTRRGLLAELDIGAGYDAGVVVHIGSCKNKATGIKTIASSIEHVLEKTTKDTKKIANALNMSENDLAKKRKVILENAAGEGNKIGSTLDEISQIIKSVKPELRSQVSVCLDTAHLFGAGQYNIGDAEHVVKLYEDFENKIGIEYLECFHLNDSRAEFGSKKDRHENIGLGFIFNPDIDIEKKDGLYTFMQIAKMSSIPLIGEPPGKMSDGSPGLGGIWDYSFINSIFPLEQIDFTC